MIAGRSKIFGALAALVLVAAACGDDDDEAGDGTTTPAAATTEGGADTAPATSAGGEDTATATVGTAAGTAAESTVGSAEPPSGEPIRIGVLTSLTGPFTPWGVQVRDGMQLAVDEINAAGGVGGRPLELVVADDQSNPEEGVTAIERLVEEGVVAVGGVISSDVALATARIAEELETPLFLVKAGSEAILTQDSRYTFRTCLPAAPMVAGPIAQYAQQEGLTRVGAIIADYAWGQAIRGALEDGVRRHRGRRAADRGGARARAGLHHLPAQPRGLRAGSARRHRAPARLRADHGAVGRSRLRRPRDGRLLAVGRGGVRGRRRGHRPLRRLRLRRLCERRVPGARPALPRVCPTTRSWRTTPSPATASCRWSPRRSARSGDDPVAIAEYLHGETFDLPGYPFEVSWTEWGELAARPAAVHRHRRRPRTGGRQRGAASGTPRRCCCPSRSNRTCRDLRPVRRAVTILELDGVEKRFGGLPARQGRVPERRRRARSSRSSGPTAPARRRC